MSIRTSRWCFHSYGRMKLFFRNPNYKWISAEKATYTSTVYSKSLTMCSNIIPEKIKKVAIRYRDYIKSNLYCLVMMSHSSKFDDYEDCRGCASVQEQDHWIIYNTS